MKILNLVLATMFLVFAFLQINDADPVIWILIYGCMAVVCVMAAFRFYPKIFLIVLLVAYVSYSIILIPGLNEWLAQNDKTILFDDIAKMQHPYVEESREFLGLLICVTILAMQLIRSRKPQIA